MAQQQEESARAAELGFGERPKPKPRVGPIAGAAPPRAPAASSEAVAAATAAAFAATAGIVRPQRQKGAAKHAAGSPAPWDYAGEPSTVSHSHLKCIHSQHKLWFACTTCTGNWLLVYMSDPAVVTTGRKAGTPKNNGRKPAPPTSCVCLISVLQVVVSSLDA